MEEKITIQALSKEQALQLVKADLISQGYASIQLKKIMQMRNNYFQITVSYEKKVRDLLALNERNQKTSELIQKVEEYTKKQNEVMQTLAQLQNDCKHPFVITFETSGMYSYTPCYCICCHKYVNYINQSTMTFMLPNSIMRQSDFSILSFANSIWQMIMKEKEKNDSLSDDEIYHKVNTSFSRKKVISKPKKA